MYLKIRVSRDLACNLRRITIFCVVFVLMFGLRLWVRTIIALSPRKKIGGFGIFGTIQIHMFGYTVFVRRIPDSKKFGFCTHILVQDEWGGDAHLEVNYNIFGYVILAVNNPQNSSHSGRLSQKKCGKNFMEPVSLNTDKHIWPPQHQNKITNQWICWFLMCCWTHWIRADELETSTRPRTHTHIQTRAHTNTVIHQPPTHPPPHTNTIQADELNIHPHTHTHLPLIYRTTNTWPQPDVVGCGFFVWVAAHRPWTWRSAENNQGVVRRTTGRPRQGSWRTIAAL